MPTLGGDVSDNAVIDDVGTSSSKRRRSANLGRCRRGARPGRADSVRFTALQLEIRRSAIGQKRSFTRRVECPLSTQSGH